MSSCAVYNFSSDSEDDSFLNIARKLTAIKKDFPIDDSETKQNDSQSPEKASSPSKNKKNKKSPAKKTARLKSTDSDSSGSIDLEAFRSEFPPINEPKRLTRAAKRKSAQNLPNLADSQVSLPRRRKKNNASTIAVANEIAGNSNADENVVISNEAPPRGRGRGRGRGRARGRNRNARNTITSFSNTNNYVPSIMDILQAMVPTYSVGNTDEYPDQSDNQQLFGSRKENIPVAEEVNESLEDNEEYSVKVYWQSLDYFRFQIRKYQKFTVIYDFFAKKENVSYDKLLFTYKDNIVKPEDTPESIDYSIAKFIDGGVVNQSVTHLMSNSSTDVKDGVKLKFQCQNVKKPFELYVKPDDKLSSAMMRCAEHFEKSIDKLRFEFDGDVISGKSTPKELELEGGECIDVKVLS